MTQLISLIGLITAIAGPPATAPPGTPKADGVTPATQRSPHASCADGSAGEIVVCGRPNDRYRIPRQVRDESAAPAPGIRPNMPLQASDFAPCGIFQGQRFCGKNEAEQYGYGGDRELTKFVTKIVEALTKPAH